jgi:hypothetical protein
MILVGKWIPCLGFDAVGLDGEPTAAIITAVVGPIAFVRRGRKR